MASEKQQTNKSQILHSLSSSDLHSDTTNHDDLLRFLMNSSTNPIIILDDDDDEVTPEPPKKKTKLGAFNDPTPFNYSGSLISNNSIIILDDDKDETLEPWNNNKTRLGFRNGYVDPFDELGIVVRGLTKKKEEINSFASKFDSYFPPTNDLNENKNNENSSIILESPKNSETKLGLGSGYVDPFDELSVVVKEFQKRKEENKGFASTDLNEEKKEKEKEKVPESKGYGYWHDDLEDLDEGLISIPFPWEDLDFDLMGMEPWQIPS